MVRVYLNNGTLYKFKKVRPNFADGNIYIPYDDIVYKEELKNIYKVVKKIKGYDKLEQVLYRGYLLKRGIAVEVTKEVKVNKKGFIINGEVKVNGEIKLW